MGSNDMLKNTQINSKGFGIISKLVMQDRSLHTTAKAIYAYLNSYAGMGDVCFPTVTKMCYDLNISRDTLQKYLNQLIDNGYIIKQQVRIQGKFSHNNYTICSEVSTKPKTTVAENIGYGIGDYGIGGTDRLDSNNNNIKNNNIKNNSSGCCCSYIPDLQDIKNYINNNNYTFSPEHFYNYYARRNWCLGNKVITSYEQLKSIMDNWQLKETTKDTKRAKELKVPKGTFNNYNQRIYTTEELEEIVRRKECNWVK